MGERLARRTSLAKLLASDLKVDVEDTGHSFSFDPLGFEPARVGQVYWAGRLDRVACLLWPAKRRFEALVVLRAFRGREHVLVLGNMTHTGEGNSTGNRRGSTACATLLFRVRNGKSP